jgi:nucleotide-binding universal stress UspA family protein
MNPTTFIWATDGSSSADGALEVVRDFAKHWKKPRIVALHIDQRLAGRAGDVPVLADEPDTAAKIESQVRELQSEGFEAAFELHHTHRAKQASMIASIAKDIEADVIVVGTRGHRPVTGALLGSVAQGLLHSAPCPVLVIPPAVAKQLTGTAIEDSTRVPAAV